MLYVIHCLDKKDSLIRQQHHAEHRAYLESHPLKLFTAGPLMDEAGENMIGSMMIMECESREQIDLFLKDEPFHKKGLFERVSVNRWDKRH